MNHWVHLVELFEYKVADLGEQREPRGGKRSIRVLRDALSQAPLEGPALKRFRQADKKMREQINAETLAQTPEPTVPVVTSANLNLESLSASLDATIPLEASAQDSEAAVLRDLGLKIWRSDFILELKRFFQSLRGETDKFSLRLAYSTMHNLAQYADMPGFAADVNLAKFQVIAAIPIPDDPLAPFNSQEVIDDLAEDFAKHLLDLSALYPKLRIPAQEAVSYLRRFASAVASDPRAGQLPKPITPSSREIMVAIEEAQRENMAPETKRALVSRLQNQLEQTQLKERQQASAVIEEVRAFRAVTEHLFHWLNDHLPVMYGGRCVNPKGPNKVVFAEIAERRLEGVPAISEELAVRLIKPGRVKLRNVPMAWKPSPNGWLLELGDVEYPIKDGLRVPFESVGFEFFLCQDPEGLAYMVVRTHQETNGGLWGLLARARCIAALLEPQHGFVSLRVARAAMSWLRDRHIDPSQHGMDSAARYVNASEQQIITFARNGMEKILERFERLEHTMIDRAFLAAAEAINETGAESAAQRLIARFHEALTPSSLQENDTEIVNEQQGMVLSYRGDPLTVRAVGHVFTVRLDNLGRLVAVFPGGNTMVLEDMVTHNIGAGYALVAREGMRVVVGFEPSLSKTTRISLVD